MNAQSDLLTLQRRSYWSAQMISPDCDQGQGKQMSFVSKEFQLSEAPSEALLNISALGLYRCFINGKRVGNDVLTPGWVSYDDRQPFQSYDVQEFLCVGTNRIEIWLGDGWYRSQLMWDKGPIFNCWGDKIAAIAELTLSGVVHEKTDTTWKSGLLPIMKSGIYFGENFDARVQSLSDTHGVRLVDFDTDKLTLQECSPVKEMPPIAVQSTFVDEGGKTIYDFGQNTAGYVQIKVNGESGAKVLIEHSEVLGPNQKFDNRNYRSARAALNYVLSGEGEETYKPHFTFQGFRYVRVTITGDAKLTDIQFIPISSVPDATFGFQTSNPLVQKLVENTRWSQLANFIEVPTDCPQRDERLGWTGDAQVFAPTACYMANCQNFYRKYLRDVVMDQREDGAIAHFSPDPTRLHPENYEGYFGSTGWGDVITIIPWTLYLHYGDTNVLAECYSAMKRWVDFVWSISDGPIVTPPVHWGKKGFTFGDWLQPTGDSRKPRPTIGDDCAATIYHYISTDLFAKIAGILGYTDEAEEYAKRANVIREAFADEFITPSGRISYSDQTSYALAFLHDLIPDQHIEAAKDYFRKTVEISEGRVGTGFIGTPALLPALVKIGADDLAAQVFLQEDVPGWMYQIVQGATSIWERWDSIAPDGTIYDPEMNSYNHYSYGAVCQWLIESVAGFRPTAENPGFEHIIFKPLILNDLGPIEVHHDSCRGRIKAAWSLNGGVATYRITVPNGATAEFQPRVAYVDIAINGAAQSDASSVPLEAGDHEITFRVI